MATVLNIDTNFVGKEAGAYIAEIVKGANTIDQRLVTVLADLTSPVFVRKIAVGTGLQNYSCGFSPLGTVAISERELAPKKLKDEYELCKEDFRQLWTSIEMGLSAHNDQIPATERDAILDLWKKKIALLVEKYIWIGTNTAGQFAGFIPQFLADEDVTKIEGVAITSANVEVEVAKWIDSISDEVLGADDVVLGVSTNVIRALRRAYGKEAIANGTFINANEFLFDGYILTEIIGLEPNTMVAYVKPNLFFGTSLLSDHSEVRIKDMDESLLTGNIRMKMVFTGGVQYAYGQEVFLYSDQYTEPEEEI